ncbi:MAG: YkgJ family cysteine cluster protein [Fimbriiglobus sp.]
MPMPVRSLPVVQNWDCHSCGDCCRSYTIRVTEPEKARIESQGWATDPAIGDTPGVISDGNKGWKLNHRDDGSCVFLDDDQRCRIHAKFGAAGKPMACRIYPFVLVPAGDHWRVGVRMACPSAAKDLGRPLTAHAEDLATYAGLVEEDAGGVLTSGGKQALPAPELVPGHSVAWPDLLRFVDALREQMADDETPVEHRLRKLFAIAELCKKSRFDNISGTRLNEFLEIITSAVCEDVPLLPKDVPSPGWAGRMIFRQILAICVRRDSGRYPGIASQGRLTRMLAAWRFAMGRGAVPRLHGLMPETTFASTDQPLANWTPECEKMLERYYLVKLESMQFAGPLNFHRPFWLGLDSLLLTYPMLLWLTRVFAAHQGRSVVESLTLALQTIDDSFGFNPLLGTARQTWAIRTLAERQELPRLIAGYSPTRSWK